MMFPNASDNAKVVNQKFTVVDMYESGMSEYDSTFAFCRLDQLQDFRGMIDPQTGVRSVTTIQLKLAEGADLNAVRDALRERFPPDIYAYNIQTWRDMQGPLLAAVRLETTILNILLFLIIAVAGFGILATFFMIVVEKTRDIGTLKALGASGRGVMSIFLSYGLLLGFVGSGAGLIGGLLVRQSHQRSRIGDRDDHGTRGVRSDGLLLHRDPHHHSSVHARVGDGRSRHHRDHCQRSAGDACRPHASGPRCVSSNRALRFE